MEKKIYTTTGDHGLTFLGKAKLPKNSLQIHLIGALDELNSWLGYLKAAINEETLIKSLHRIQKELFNLSSEIADPDKQKITQENIKKLEIEIDGFSSKLSPLNDFIIPGSSKENALAHISRTICRRCERNLVELNQQKKLSPFLLIYLNRLSDWLFIISRVLS